MRKRLFASSNGPERIGLWLWGVVGAAVAVAAVVLVLGPSDGDVDSASPFVVPASEVSPLGHFGGPDGEGLTPPGLAAVSGKTNTADGGAEVPLGTVDGPGRRIFAGATVRLPPGRTPFEIRQIVPGDLNDAREPPAFVRWEGWAAILTPHQVRARATATNLSWQKTGAGLQVPAGSTLRLRTLFRLPQSSGTCNGPALPAGSKGHRAEETLRRAPAWMIRRAGRMAPWGWLRATSNDVTALPEVVRTGPTRPVLFRASQVCKLPQPRVTVEPDPDPSDVKAGPADLLPVESTAGY